MPKIEIKTNGVVGTIHVDGVQLKGVVGYEVKHSVSGLPTVLVHLHAKELHIDASEASLGIQYQTSLNDDSRQFTAVAPLLRSGA